MVAKTMGDSGRIPSVGSGGGHVGGAPVSNKQLYNRKAPRRGKAQGQGLYSERPLLLLCLLLMAVLFLLHLARCDYYVKESHCIEYSVVILWENPTPHGAMSLQIIMNMIFIEQ